MKAAAKLTAEQLLSEDVLLTTKELAMITKEQASSIYVKRCKGLDPIPHIKIGSLVRYRSADVREYLENLQLHRGVQANEGSSA
jgi:hypothetical protein